MRSATGFPKKDARFLKWKNISDILKDERGGKIKENIYFKYVYMQSGVFYWKICRY